MGCKQVWDFTETSLSELEDDGITPTGKVFNYDMVFSPEDDTNQLYEKQCRPIVMSAMEGYNGTVFAYGQTSSGRPGRSWVTRAPSRSDHPCNP